MATGVDLKNIAQARLRSAEILISANDWQGAAYMLPYTLECALKAVICKTLNLQVYPEDDDNKTDVRSFFFTHVFLQLIVVSGLSDIFSPTGQEIPYKYWSDFTIQYPGKWVQMRYNLKVMEQFDEVKVRDLYSKLTDPINGILTVIDREKRW